MFRLVFTVMMLISGAISVYGLWCFVTRVLITHAFRVPKEELFKYIRLMLPIWNIYEFHQIVMKADEEYNGTSTSEEDDHVL